MAATIFEKTMNMCLESKRAQRTTLANKALKESVAAPSTKKITNEDVDDPENLELPSDPIEDPDMPDTVDDIVVVVDPDLDADDVNEFANELQDLVDSTPDGQTPTMDDYLGDLTYTCPICANTFFSDHEISHDEACPVCGETPTAFILAGAVADAEEVAGSEEPKEEEIPEGEPVEEPVEEPEDNGESEEDLEPVEPESEEDESVKVSAKRAESKKVNSIYTLDEKTFNPFMTKFIRENYKNAKDFRVLSAKRSGRALSLECRITFLSGKTKNVTLSCEKFVPLAGKESVLSFRDNGAFKNESRSNAPFMFRTVIEGKTIKCTGLKYNFITVAEGKKVQVSGNLIRESKTRK